MKGLRLIKVLFATLLLTLTAQVAKAQIKFGDNPGNINGKAVLELESTDKGLLIPRMTTTLRTAIAPGVSGDGMMVYDTDLNCTFVFRADSIGSVTAPTGWQSLCAEDAFSAANGLTKVGKEIRLGGNLDYNTTINAGNKNLSVTYDSSDATKGPLRLTGVQTSYNPATNRMDDSILTINAGTGFIRKVKVADFFASNNLDSFVWKLDGNTVPSMKTIGTKNNFALPFITNNIERMRLDANGNLGIGTNAPAYRLDVDAITGGTGNPARLQGLNSGANGDSVVTSLNGVLRRRSVDELLGDQNTAWKTIGNSGLNATNNFVGTIDAVDFVTRTNNTERMRVLASNGNVGIGTNAPAEKLTVDGGNLSVTNTVATSALTATAGSATSTVTGTTTATSRTVSGSNSTQIQADATTSTFTGTVGTTSNQITANATTSTFSGTVGTSISQVVTTGTTSTVSGTVGSTTGKMLVQGDSTTMSTNGTGALVLSTGGSTAPRVTVLSDGKVGMGRSTATSNLHLGGSIALPIRTEAAAYSVTIDDYTIVTDCTSGAFTLTLPAASSCSGRTYVIIKSDLTTNALTFSPSLKLGTGGTTASNSLPSINYNSRIHIQSDGTNWWLLARF